MLSRALVLFSVVVAAFAPTASADCVDTTCFLVESHGTGTCDDGHAVNVVHVWSFLDGRLVEVYAGTSCSGQGGASRQNDVYAGAGVHSDPRQQVDLVWSGAERQSGPTCSTALHASGIVEHSRDIRSLCNLVGAPPRVPALLP